MPAFAIRVSQLRGGDTLRFGNTAPSGQDHGPLLPRGTRLYFSTSLTTKSLTAQPQTTRLT